MRASRERDRECRKYGTAKGFEVRGPYRRTESACLRVLGASNSVYGLGCALGPVIGTAVWGGAGRGLWLWCGALGLVAAMMTWAGVVPAEPEQEE